VELALVAVGALAYRQGAVRLRARPAGRALVPTWRLVAFGLGIAVVTAALLPPIETLAHELFAVHMLQHIMLFLIGAPLLAAGAPTLVVPKAFPGFARRINRRVRRRLPRPDVPATVPLLVITGAALHVVALWAWHTPVLYDAALANGWLHALEHLSFVVPAMIFWTGLLHPARKRRLSSGMGVLAIWLLLAQGGIVSALLVFSDQPLYVYTGAHGLTAMEDQQLGGVLMWMPGSIVYGIAGIATFLQWFRAMEGRERGYFGAETTIARAPDPAPGHASDPPPLPGSGSAAGGVGPSGRPGAPGRDYVDGGSLVGKGNRS
jgi:putative membrane protein